MMSEEDEDILFDRSGVIITDEDHLLSDQDWSGFNDSPVSGSPVLVRTNAVPQHVKGRIFQTICLCAAFFGLGLCIAIPGPTLLDLQEQTNTDTEEISRLFTGRSVGYLFGSLIGGLLFDRVNQTCLLALSLLLTAIGTAAAPWCTNFLFLIGILAFQGISMGFLDTGGNVLCLQIWGRGSGPYMQAMHFVFGLGAFVAPLLAEPFLSRTNSTNVTIFENISEFDVSSLNIAALHSRHLLSLEDARSVSPIPPTLSNVSTTINPKFQKPESSDGKFLSQDSQVADGRKYGKLNYENEKKQKKIPLNGVSIVEVIPMSGNSTANDTTVTDTGQVVETTTKAPSTTVAPTTTSALIFNVVTVNSALWENASIGDGESESNHTSSEDSTLDILRHKFKQVARTVTEVFNSFTKVQFAYLMIAAFVLLVSFMFMFHCCCCGRCSCIAVKYQDPSINYKIKKESPGFRVQILILLFVFYFLYVGMEVTYGGLVMSFAVNHLHWSKSSGTLVNSVFWGSFAAGRLLAIPLSKCLKPATMIVADLVLTIFALAGLVIMLNTNHIMLWFCTATLGIGLASIFPTGITWAERYMQVTGKSTAVFVVGSALGEMLLPLITGFLFQNKGPMWLMYIMMGCAFLSIVVYIIMQNLASNMGERYEPVSQRRHGRSNGNSTVIQLHSINSDDDEEEDEQEEQEEGDSVPLINGSEDLLRRHKKVRFNLRNGSAKFSKTPIANGSKASILKSRTEKGD